MKLSSRFLHGIYRKIVNLILQIHYDFTVWNANEKIEGPVIFCANHFSSSDAHFVTCLTDHTLHMIVGPGFKIPIVRRFLKATEQIPALTKEDRSKVVSTAVEYLNKGESIFIFPEGRLYDVNEGGMFHKGLSRIYLEKKVKIIPIGLIAPKRRVKKKNSTLANRDMTVVSKNYYANIGKPIEFDKDIDSMNKEEAENYITNYVKKEIEFLIYDIKTNKFWS